MFNDVPFSHVQHSRLRCKKYYTDEFQLQLWNQLHPFKTQSDKYVFQYVDTPVTDVIKDTMGGNNHMK